MLTPKEAFVVGFVRRCIDDGLSAEQMDERVKQAEDLLAGALTSLSATKEATVLGDVARAGGGVLSTVAPLALAAPPLLGGLAGYTAARLGDVDDTDVEDVRQQELKDTYKLEAEKLRRQKAFRDLQKARQRSVRGYYG